MAQKTSKDVLDELAEETAEQHTAELKALLRATLQAIKERKMWMARRQKEISELTEIQVDAVRSFDGGTFDALEQKEMRVRLWEITHRAQPMTEAERKARKEEMIRRFRGRYGHDPVGLVETKCDADDE